MVRRLLKILQQMMQDFYSVLDRFGSLYPSKHSSWWRRTEDVLSVTFFCLQRRLEYILRTSSRHNFKASSWRRLQEDVFKTSWKTSWRCLEIMFWRHLEDILKTSCKDVLKTFLEDVLQTRLEDVLKTTNCYAEDVFKTSYRRLGKYKMFTGTSKG